MIYLKKEAEGRAPSRASVNHEESAVQLEEQGFVRLTVRQAFLQIVFLNSILEYLLPLLTGYLTFTLLLFRLSWEPSNVFILAWIVSYVAAAVLHPLKRWN